ncbi:MAG: BMC domain-containing protein [Elusimicrobia bacterium]|nr:BMC domain-containing protein [Elusimicrobiota bacterium]
MKPAIAFLELSSISKGIETVDAMMKMAEVDLLQTQAIPRGKFTILIGGEQAEVEQSLQAGIQTADKTLIDFFLIPNVHQQVLPALQSRIQVKEIEAVGVIETKDVAASIFAADAAVKKAAVTLIEVFPGKGAGGKGFVTFTGEVGAVRSAVNAGVETIKKEGMLIGSVVIPYAHKSLLKALTQ